MVMEREPSALHAIAPVLRERRDAIQRRIGSNDTLLREAFDALEVLDYRRNYDQCIELVMQALQ